MEGKIIKDHVEYARYNRELKRQGDTIIDNAFFDPTKNLLFEEYFQVHIKLHKIHAAALYTVTEWRKINVFMKGIKQTK